MRSSLLIVCLFLAQFLNAQSIDIELFDVQVPDSADANLELQISAKIINHGPASWNINNNGSIMRYALLDSVPDSLDYSNLSYDQEDIHQGQPLMLSAGDTLDYTYRLDVSSKGGGGKGITVIIWPTRAASLQDNNLPNGFYIASSQTPNVYNAVKGLNQNGKGNGPNANSTKIKVNKSKRLGKTKELSVYPNPTDKLCYIQLPEEGGVIDILDLQGKRVYHQEALFEERLVIPLKAYNLPTGLYLVRWQKDDRIETDKVWIISH